MFVVALDFSNTEFLLNWTLNLDTALQDTKYAECISVPHTPLFN